MIPVKLTLSGFLSYRDPVEVDFSTFDLACISGANGAGKSSLLDAMTFALFGQARKRDESVINTASESADVELTFEYEGNLYRVQRVNPRGKTTLLEFHIQNPGGGWKALTERTMRDTDALIQETLRLDYETFVNASFFLQGKADQFTQQRPGDRKRILSSILGLEVWEEYRQRASERRRAIEQDLKELQGRLSEINAELDEEAERKAALKDLNEKLEQLAQARGAQENALGEMRRRSAAVEQQAQLVSTLAAQLERAQAARAKLLERLEARRAEQAEHAELLANAEKIKEDFADWKKLREELTKWEEIAGRFNEQERRRNDPLTAIETERARLETELQGLRASEQELEQAAERRADLKKASKAAKEKIKAIEKDLAERAALDKELKLAEKEQTEAATENPILKREMDELKERINAIKKAKGAECPTCGQPLTEEHRDEMVALWTKEGTERGDKFRANKVALESADKRVADLKARVKQLQQADDRLRAQTRLLDQASSSLEELEKLEATWESERAPRIKELEKKLKDKDFAAEARAQLAEIDAELKEIGYDAAQHDALRAKEKEARQAEARMRALEQAQAASQPLQREIGELEKQLAEQDKDLTEQEAAHKEAAAALAAAESELPDVVKAEREMLDLQEQENRARQEVGAAQQRVAVLDELRKRKAELGGQREELAAQIGQYQALERAFGKDGVPAMLIEQALPQIETKANEILERLSGGNMHIRFVTQKEYKDSSRDDLRETLEIQISDSAGDRDYEMFSGGEAFRINFAIRLALSEVLAQRAGARLQTLVIDEGFGSQDAAGRQRLVEAINLVRADFEKILVITHIDSLKDAFPTRIEVEKGPRGSVVEVL